jgi:hypothetical protein
MKRKRKKGKLKRIRMKNKQRKMRKSLSKRQEFRNSTHHQECVRWWVKNPHS